MFKALNLTRAQQGGQAVRLILPIVLLAITSCTHIPSQSTQTTDRKVAGSSNLPFAGDFIERSPFLQTLHKMYGGPGSGRCFVRMGWGAESYESHVNSILYHVEHLPLKWNTALTQEGSVKRELDLFGWGASDPNSWTVYKRVKETHPQFIRKMTAYYLLHFAQSRKEARDFAELAYAHIVGRVFYRGTVMQPSDSYREHLSEMPSLGGLNRRSSPLAVAKGIAHGGSSATIDAVIGAIYTRDNEETISILWNELKQRDANARRTLLHEPRFYINEHSRPFPVLGNMLIAALGDAKLVKLVISFGADIDAKTNAFGKTALMYAAQSNDIESVQLLLEAGANPSAKTEAESVYCVRLFRDSRTPLMYAAENGSARLINLLLDAGADTAAVDTQGSKADWYLGLNESISSNAKRNILKRLNSRS